MKPAHLALSIGFMLLTGLVGFYGGIKYGEHHASEPAPAVSNYPACKDHGGMADTTRMLNDGWPDTPSKLVFTCKDGSIVKVK